jgi:hypothetical protein
MKSHTSRGENFHSLKKFIKMKRKMFLVATLGAAVMAGSLFAACEKEKSDKEKGQDAGAAVCACIGKAGDDEAAQTKCFQSVDVSKMPNFVGSDEPDVTKFNEYEQGFMAGILACAGSFGDYSVLRK